ncbi:MAG: shikimate dehydrogenase [Candidatus Methanodesulfokora sp.]
MGPDLILGVMGDPIEHSLSPVMHNRAMKAVGINGVYLKFRVPPALLADALRGIRALGIRGVNLTMPLKTIAFQMMDYLDEDAEETRAVNTVLNDGKLRGFNTDVGGFSDSLPHKPDRVVVLGAGGAASAVLLALSRLGSEITVMGRSWDKTVELARRFGARPVEFKLWKLEEIDWDLLVNATPLGMSGFPELDVPVGALKPGRTVFDLVYSPPRTKLIREAEMRRCKTISGLLMLVNQGARSFRIFTGVEPPLEEMMEAVGLERRG